MDDLICISPVDGREYARRAPMPPAEVERAIAVARRAQQEWALAPLRERCAVVARFLEAMESLNGEIVPELAWQMGRPVRHGGELGSLVERVQATVELAEQALAPDRIDERRWIAREPAGLVLVVAPWNYPFLTAANTIAPALLAGNSVLLKPAAQTLLTGERFAQALGAAGLPDGLFTTLFLSHAQTARLIGSGAIDHAVFTGSIEGGRQIESAAAGSLTTLTLELGGKDAAYVRGDADVAASAAAIAEGAFYNSGQSCCAVERVYVDEAVWEPFLAALVGQAQALRLGDPLDPETSLGPMATAKGAATVRRQVEGALAGGARGHVERQLFPAGGDEGAYVMPQVLTGVTHDMALMRDETFGPVVGVIPVRGDDDAVRLMNDSRYGLAASIWTADLDAAKRLGRSIEAGTVLANRCDYLDPALAWSGRKESGYGASLGRYGFEAVTRPKSFHLWSV